MARGEKLAIEYLSRRPADAARVLERIGPDKVSALIARTPARIVGPVLSHMLPTSAAHCVEHLEPSAIGLLLQHMSAQVGAALLRHLDAELRERVLGELSGVQTASLRFLLGYPVTTVGAWMEPRVFTLPDDCTVGEALDRLRQSRSEASHRVYVLDRDRLIRGAVSAVGLLRGNPDADIDELLGEVSPLRARMPLEEARTHGGWRESAELPVVNRQREFVGVLWHAELVRAEARLQAAGDETAGAPLVGGLGEIFGLGLAGLWDIGLELVTHRRDEPRGNQSHER